MATGNQATLNIQISWLEMEMKLGMEVPIMEVVMTAIVEVVRTAIMEVVRTAIVEVVRTAITKGEYNMAEIEKMLTVKKGDIDVLEDTNVGDMVIFKFGKAVVIKMKYKTAEITIKEEDINMSEDIDIKRILIFQFVEFVDIKFLDMVETVVNKEECNMAEVHKELTVEEGDINIFEDNHMKNVYIVKFVEVVKKVFYNEEDTVAGGATCRGGEGHKEAFIASATWRQDSVLSWRGKELVEFVVSQRLHLGRAAV
jgi:hypothetical protein